LLGFATLLGVVPALAALLGTGTLIAFIAVLRLGIDLGAELEVVGGMRLGGLFAGAGTTARGADGAADAGELAAAALGHRACHSLLGFHHLTLVIELVIPKLLLVAVLDAHTVGLVSHPLLLLVESSYLG